jgi:chromate reductase, NAD(P)H dehydrogenase (quinone)
VRYRLLLISGSLRAASTSFAALLAAGQLVPAGVEPVLYRDLGALPHFNPDRDVDPLDTAVSDLRRVIHLADAVVFSTPEYAGALPGSFKNLLDWTIGDDQPGSIYEKPVVWLNVSPRGAEGAHQELRTVLQYAHADIVEAACVDVPVTQAMIDDSGMLSDPAARGQIALALSVLGEHMESNGSRP